MNVRKAEAPPSVIDLKNRFDALVRLLEKYLPPDALAELKTLEEE